MTSAPGPCATPPSKSGVPTLRVNDMFWHSGYDPVREARLWVDTLSIEKNCVLLVGEGMGYLKQAIEERFPDKTLFVIAVQGQESSRRFWSPQSPISLQQFLLGFINGKSAATFQTFVWPQAKNIAPEWVKAILETWNRLLVEQEANSATFQGMGRRWLVNTLTRAWDNPPVGLLNPTDAPVLLLASGPSAEPYLTRDFGSNFLIASLASSLKALEVRGLEADFYAVTDGGYWAKRLETNRALPCASPLASVAPSKSSPWLAFTQGFHYEQFFLEEAGVPSIPSRGTVAYSALRYLTHFFKGPIGVAGLDLGETRGKPHLRPHPLDEWFWDDRLATPENRLAVTSILRSSRKIAPGFYQSSAQRLYTLGLEELDHPRLYRIGTNLIPLRNMATITMSDWLDLCRTHKSPLAMSWKTLDLRSRALAWKQKVERALQRQEPEDPYLAEAFRHLCPAAWDDFRQSALENNELDKAFYSMEREFLIKWNQLWSMFTDS